MVKLVTKRHSLTADELKHIVTEVLIENRALDVNSIDIRGVSDIADFMILATGTSKRHAKTIAEKLIEHCKKGKIPIVGNEGLDNSEWVLVDLADIIVHVMQANTRKLYQLEKLWGIESAESG